MLKPVQAILFATDLTKNCQQALELTIAIGARFNATVYMLHVIENLSEDMQNRIKDVLGRHQWDELVNAHVTFAHKSLLGKQSMGADIRKQLHDFCSQAGIEDDSCDLQSREILISDGEVVKDILSSAKENDCDLIILGASEAFFTGNSIGSTIKSVLKGSNIPVTVVPAIRNEK